jgi:hypothetical protein
LGDMVSLDAASNIPIPQSLGGGGGGGGGGGMAMTVAGRNLAYQRTRWIKAGGYCEQAFDPR